MQGRTVSVQSPHRQKHFMFSTLYFIGIIQIYVAVLTSAKNVHVGMSKINKDSR